MHIPDGYLSPQTYVPLYGASTLLWAWGARKIRSTLSTREVPYVAMAAAFSFLIQMFNIPVPGGTTGHAVGSAVIALILGPWTALMATSAALLIQALVFGDGGITAFGANCFNMAFVMPFAAYYTFIALTRLWHGRRGTIIGAFVAGYVGLTLAGLCTALQFGIQPIIAHDALGTPLYAPYPLSVALPAMVVGHLLLFSPIEGLITALLIRYFLLHDPGFIAAARAARTGIR